MSRIAFRVLLKLRKYHENDDQILVYSNDFIGLNVYSKGVYERHEIISILSSLSGETMNNTCLDIGANIGNHSIQFSKSFKNIKSFEPNQKTFEVLRINTQSYSNIEVFNYGLSDSNKTTNYQSDIANQGGGKVVEQKTDQTIELKNYDSEFDQPFSFAKIDVEGHELKVLKGMKENIQKHKPIICFEANFGANNELDQLLLFLKQLGYTELYTSIEQNFLLEKFNYKLKPLFTLLFGLFYPKHQNKHGVKSIKTIDRSYKMVLAVHPDSPFKVN